jgi:hypothetical protein
MTTVPLTHENLDSIVLTVENKRGGVPGAA